jgi:hypothetical protein
MVYRDCFLKTGRMGARSTLEELNAWISLSFNFGFIPFNNAVQRARKLDRGGILAVCVSFWRDSRIRESTMWRVSPIHNQQLEKAEDDSDNPYVSSGQRTIYFQYNNALSYSPAAPSSHRIKHHFLVPYHRHRGSVLSL